jgi:hypothetical protein
VDKLLELSYLEKLFPPSWRDFVPSPRRDYIDVVRRELITFGVMPPEGDHSFDGFCNVPRYFHPAASEEALGLSLELICWYFYFDDPFDDGVVSDGKHVVERMLATLDSGKRFHDNLTPIEKLCRQIQRRAALLSGNRDIYERFLFRCADWVRSILPITAHKGRRISLDDYDRLRVVNVGIMPEYTLNEMFGELRLSAAFLELPAVKRLGEIAALIIAYCNDIYSYEREMQHKTQLNSLEIRRLKDHASLSRAYAGQLERIAHMIGELTTLIEQLRVEGVIGWSTTEDTVSSARRRRQQTQYVDGMTAIIAGNHYWSLSGGRYHSATSPFVELRSDTRPVKPGLRVRSSH